MRNLILLFCLALLSCSESSDDEIPPITPVDETPVYLLHKVFKDGTLSSERSYSADSMLTSQIRYSSSGSIFQRQEYNYSGDTIITISFTGNNDTTQVRYSYPVDNATVRVDRLEPDYSLDNFAIYTYANDSCAFNSITFYNPDGSAFSSSTLEYTDANCSSVTHNFDGAGNLTSTQTTSRDEERSPPYRLVQLFRTENQGNILEVTFLDENDNPVPTASYVNEIDYNEFGYPITITTTFSDNTSEVYTYEYW